MPISPGGFLTVRAVRDALRPIISISYSGYAHTAACRRWSRSRVDCALRDDDDDGRCRTVFAFVLRRSGALTEREYVGRRAPCAITRHPRWRPEPWAFDVIWPFQYKGD
jgi:hypothetical protein